MADLDEELSRAVEESEAREVAMGGVVAPVSQSKPQQSLKAKGSVALLAFLLAAGGGILALVLTSVNDSAIYAKGVDELLAEKDRLGTRMLNVNGTLVKGSLKSNVTTRTTQPCEYRFSLEKNGKTIPVRFSQCVVPDTFKDVPDMDVDVTATGRYASAGYFEADKIMAKCPSKYEMKERAAAGETAPHGPVAPGMDGYAPAYSPGYAPAPAGAGEKIEPIGVPENGKQG
jgi:cytochrome c-type biogenesis protein CcmE